MKERIKKQIIGLIPPLALLVATVCIYMPSTLFLGNIDEFAIDYITIVPIILVVSLVVILVVMLIGMFLPTKIYDIYRMIVFGGAIGFYIQGNFLNPKFNSLNGAEIDWSRYTVQEIISTVAWIVCIAVPVIVFIYRKNIMNNIAKWSSLFLVAVQLISLIAVILTTGKNVDSSYALTKDGEFVMSGKKNIVTFVVDTLDAQWAEEYINNNETYKELLKDFTYFDNVVAGGAPTELGIPTLLTGVNYDISMTSEEYHKQAYEQSTFFKDLQDNNYDVKIYTDYHYLNGADKENINNLVSGQEYKISSTYNFTKYLYKLTGFYAMPQLLKSKFWFYGNDLSECVKVADENVSLYYFDDPAFYKDLNTEGLRKEQNKNTFVLYHLFGAHGPYTMDASCNKVEENASSLDQQIYGNFKIIMDYIEQMKTQGIYDDSTIVITADHGGVNLYQNPAVYVKTAGTHNEQMASDDSAATFRNVRATWAATALNNYSAYGPTLFEMKNNTDVRYHIAPKEIGTVMYPENQDIANQEWTKYEIRGNARDMNSISPIKK
jgi:hypothetical protein